MAIQRETQVRTQYTGVNILGFNAYLHNGATQTASNILNDNGFPNVESTAYISYWNQRVEATSLRSHIHINDDGPNRPNFWRGIGTNDWLNAGAFGFEVQQIMRPEGRINTICSWEAEQDPRGYTQYNFLGSYAKLSANLINVSTTGYIEWTSVINDPASNRNIVCGVDGGTDDGIWFRNNAGEPYPVYQIGSQIKTTTNWSNPNDGLPHTHRFTRRGGRVYYSYDGVEHPTSFAEPSFQFNFDALGRGGVNSADNIGMTNLRVQVADGGPVDIWACLETTGSWRSNDGDPVKTFNLQGYSPTNWQSYGGFAGRMIFTADGRTAGQATWSIGTESVTLVDDGGFFTVQAKVLPNLGDLTLTVVNSDSSEVQSVTVPSADWIDNSTNSDNHLEFGSGGSSTTDWEARITLFNMFIYEDNRTFTFRDNAFDLNAIAGVIATDPATVEILDIAKGAAKCSMVEIDFLDNTPVTISVTDGTIDGQPSITINDPASAPNNNVRRAYIVKTSEADDTGVLQQTYLSTQLHDGG